jgi:hypothetical protein
MKLTERYFKQLSAQSNLRSIILENCDFESSWLLYLSKCKRLHSIALIFKSCSPQSNIIRSLEKNTVLRELTLEQSEITDEDIMVLEKLIDLEKLALSSCTFQTNQGIECFYEFIEMRAINLKKLLLDTPDIEKHIQAIIDKPTLDLIFIVSDKITNEIISNIKMPIGHKKRIVIKSNSISDVGLMQIQLTPDIELCLYESTITEEGLKKFLSLNPSIIGKYNNHSEVELTHK